VLLKGRCLAAHRLKTGAAGRKAILCHFFEPNGSLFVSGLLICIDLKLLPNKNVNALMNIYER
jgi:hypothetical protein